MQNNNGVYKPSPISLLSTLTRDWAILITEKVPLFEGQGFDSGDVEQNLVAVGFDVAQLLDLVRLGPTLDGAMPEGTGGVATILAFDQEGGSKPCGGCWRGHV